jgi:mono/diheme cytochrome c family protein
LLAGKKLMKHLVWIAGLLSGCVYNISPPQFGADHPASAEAASAPLPTLSRSLAAYDPAAAPDPEAPDHGSMDHSSMGKGSMDSTMKGMDHGSMKSAEQGSTNGRNSMQGMDHGSMKGMDHGAHWMAPPEEQKRKNPIRADAKSIARGKQLFETHCATCHGKTGQGDGPAAAALNPKPANLVAMSGQHPDGDYAWKIANGRGQMPAWKGVLSENQIWDVVNFVQSLGDAIKSGAEHDHSKHKH